MAESASSETPDSCLKIYIAASFGAFLQEGVASVKLMSDDDDEKIEEATVTVRDPKTDRVVLYERLWSDELVFTAPQGAYLVEVESPGHRRSSFVLELGDQPGTYSAELDESAIP